jgi:hypothetical protein
VLKVMLNPFNQQTVCPKRPIEVFSPADQGPLDEMPVSEMYRIVNRILRKRVVPKMLETAYT